MRLRRATGAAFEVVAWAVVLALVWLAGAPDQTAVEGIVGIVAGLVSGVVACAARRAFGVRWSMPASCWSWFARIPGTVLADLARLRHLRSGRIRTTRLPGRPGEPAAALATRRALAGLVLATGPGCYPVHVRADGDEMELHVLGPPTGLERAVGR